MSSHFLAKSLLLFLLAYYADLVYSKVHYIKPSELLDSPCLQNASSCLTLSQFAANSNFSHNETHVSLLFLPGHHTLDQKLLLAHGHNFSMSKYAKDNETVYVKCISLLGSFDISETISVSIKSLNFIGCGSNRVSRVTWLMIADSTFRGVEDQSAVLVINNVSTTKIVRSMFLNNTLEHCDSNTSLYLKSYYEVLDYIYHQQNTSSGVLYTAFSNVSVVSCRFMYNRADIGGALVAHNSSLHIDKSTLSYNTANFGGAMVTSGSMIDIDNSIFTHNSARNSGGVMVTNNDRVSISSSTFTENIADVLAGGVMCTLGDSLFTISNSNFTSNSATMGGVMDTSGDSSYNISNSNFTSNSATAGGVMRTLGGSFTISKSNFTSNSATRGGVIDTLNNSSFSINNSNFISNSATLGGVMITFDDSSFTISNSNFTSNTASIGGVMYTSGDSSFIISNSNFTSNSATCGGVMDTLNNSSFCISNTNFTSNSATLGGVMITFDDSSFTISNSNFTSNTATSGGVMHVFGDSLYTISKSNFTSNSATIGGVMDIYYGDSSWDISNSSFTSNTATRGGVMVTSGDSSFNISNSNFTSNSANYGGVMATSGDCLFTINNSNFTSNSATYVGGVISTSGDSLFTISNSNFTSNSATRGGVIYTSDTGDNSFTISNSNFTSNTATSGGVMQILSDSLYTISNSNFTSNSATRGGVMVTSGDPLVTISKSNFFSNSATMGGVMATSGDSLYDISNSNFASNSATNDGGVIYMFYSESSLAIFYSNFTSNSATDGGVMYILYSDFSFITINSIFTSNSAEDGGAILAIDSTIIINGETTITNNNITAIDNSIGGGISLKQSRLEIRGKCKFTNNSAMRGGGIHVTSSIIAVYQPGLLWLINNNAKIGGGMYLELNSKLYVLKPYITLLKSSYVNFAGNNARYGGAVYVADDTNSGTCSTDSECFIQTLALHQYNDSHINTVTIYFVENTATEQGSDLFGGLLDRCIPSPLAEVYQKKSIHYSGITYLENITDIAQIHSIARIYSISSRPVRVCFCNSEQEPDCTYQLPNITVKKGEAFNVSVVAVDQVNNTVLGTITSFISSDGGFGEGQQAQSVGTNCTDLTYNVYSPHDNETITLYADGPCGNAALSTSHVTIHFSECTCPVGFEPLSNRRSPTRCECICDSELLPYITDCNIATGMVFRVNTNSWITYVNNTDSPDYHYVKYEDCPFDYCKPLTENVSINFNLPNGAETQCAYNRTGVLCGSCRRKSSLSLASSRCLPCHSHWPAVCVIILVTAILVGVLLVIALLALNMTVSVGLINGFIFYANIVSAGSAVFFPSSEPSFPSVFVAWLNLDIGIDVCFIDGLDAYIKTWLQLAFTVYIISLVVIVIIVSEYSPRFARLIGKKDPVSTLATLILLSYAKLLSVTITALSFAKLDYPDGKQEIVWLPDGNVKYFEGKHIPLVLVALLIILIGLPYTIILFLWQWIVRAPMWKVFKWTRNTKLNAFIATYHVPHNSKYRFWTGLLLLVRVVLYVTDSVTVSANPQTFPLISNTLIGGLFLFCKFFSLRVYKNSFVDAVDTVLYFNLLALSAFSLYDFKVDLKKQIAVAYTSTIVALILFIGSIFYHIKLLFKKETPPRDLNEYPLAPLQPAHAQVTFSVIEPPKRDKDARSAADEDKDVLEISEDGCNVTPPYI